MITSNHIHFFHFQGKRPILKKASELEVFKLGSRVEEMVTALVKLDLSTIVRGGGESAGRYLATLITRDKELPEKYLFASETKRLPPDGLAHHELPLEEARLECLLLGFTMIVRVLIRGLFLRPTESGLVDLKPEAVPLFVRNCKVIGIIMFRLLREAFVSLEIRGMEGSYETETPFDDIYQMIAEATPADPDFHIYQDDPLYSLMKKLSSKLDGTSHLLRLWVVRLQKELKARYA